MSMPPESRFAKNLILGFWLVVIILIVVAGGITAQLCRYQVQVISSPTERTYVVRLDRLTGNIQCDYAKVLSQP